ncbi:MAG: 50S ribosomal protein L16 [Dehalococcoidia bacterium]|jgi:large subunit ribosomal protein L16|nr:50S ribosomal protein L16 [Dehalococcoidia bacterium]
MLQPKRSKYRKEHRGRMNGIRTKGSTMVYGDFGLKAIGPGWVTAREIEAARRAITGYVKRGGQVWVRLFPDKPVSSRPAETRMGGGKGAVDHWVCVVHRGRMLYEMADVPEDQAREALRRAAHKLSIPTKIIARSEEF